LDLDLLDDVYHMFKKWSFFLVTIIQ
jgi:hypothetical protein